MNIYEVSRRVGISLSKLRSLEKLKILKLYPEEELAPALRFHLGRNAHLSVAQLLALLDAPATLDDLGRYAVRARAQLTSLGDVKAGAAPRDVTAYSIDAGKGDVAAAEILAAWLRSVLPGFAVTHHWVAVRLLIGLPESLREQNAKMLTLALLHVRKLPSFAGWWHSEEFGMRNTIKYHAKAHLPLDL